jgi:hypothetical protein
VLWGAAVTLPGLLIVLALLAGLPRRRRRAAPPGA